LINVKGERLEKAEIRKSGNQAAGYQNIRKSDLKAVFNPCKSISGEDELKKQSQSVRKELPDRC
jgi:hypothetical protein